MKNIKMLLLNEELRKVSKEALQKHNISFEIASSGSLWLIGSIKDLKELVNEYKILEEEVSEEEIIKGLDKPFSIVRSL